MCNEFAFHTYSYKIKVILYPKRTHLHVNSLMTWTKAIGANFCNLVLLQTNVCMYVCGSYAPPTIDNFIYMYINILRDVTVIGRFYEVYL